MVKGNADNNFLKTSFANNEQAADYVDLNDADVIYSANKKSKNTPRQIGDQLSFN